MKKVFCGLALLLIMVMLAPMPGTRAEETNLQATHEEFMFKALQVLARYGVDKADLGKLVPYFEKRTVAWEIFEKFDGGFFPDIGFYEFSDFSTCNWTQESETEFTVDVYGNMHVSIDVQCKMDFHLGYRFYVRLTSQGTWRIWDFEVLPSEEDIALAERLSALRPDVRFEAVTGKSFRGLLMIINDPSQLFVGTCQYFNDSSKGLTTEEMSKKYDAFAVVNGGGFSDDMKGGHPHGIVVTQGVQRQKHTPFDRAFSTLVGLTEDNEMVIGTPTLEEVEALRLRDAVAFGPVLIKDGQKMDTDTRKVHGQYTIRTVVGKDAEGRVIFLIAKGRQADSLGATTEDTTMLMLEHGVVDAANLDGGTSTALYVNGEVIYSGYRTRASRRLPTAFIVAGLGE